MWPFRKRTLGQRGEDLAARYLRRQGWKILARNLHIGRYELDIVVRQGDTVAFVEVKTRRDDAFADPDVNVTREKQMHIRKAARQYIADHYDPDTFYRYDIVNVILPDRGKPRITHLDNAFQDL